MNKVREYFKEKYDKNGPAYLQGVLRTLGRLPKEDEENVPEKDWQGVVEK